MSEALNFCPSCGIALENSPAFCPSCGSELKKPEVAKKSESAKPDGIFRRYWNRSIKGRIFYGAWVLLNVSNGINLIVSSSAPKDRFRSVCNWEGVECAPSAEEMALQSLLNLILWNLFFWVFRYFYRKRQSKKSEA